MGMDAYLYQGALYCADCGEKIAAEVKTAGAEDEGDSDGFPQGPYPDGGGEADLPQHCDAGESCAAAERVGDRAVGVFLENPLTRDGAAYVTAALAERPQDPLVSRWAEFYGIETPHGGEGAVDEQEHGAAPAEGAHEAASDPSLPPFDATHIETWFDADRAHVALYDSDSGDLLIEWWDDDLRDAIETGALDPKNLHRSAYDHVARGGGTAEEGG